MGLKLLDGLQLSVVAMLIVFSALFVLAEVMYVLPLLVVPSRKSNPKPATLDLSDDDAFAAEMAKPVTQETTVSSGGVSPEIIVAIATAVAAYLGQTPENLNIVSIHRLPMFISPWSMAARREISQS